MRLEVVEDYAALGPRALALAEAALKGKRRPVVVLPTGNTPLGFYEACVAKGPACALTRARLVQLDEYLGIARDDRRALSGWMDRILLSPLGIPHDRLIAFDPATSDPQAEAARVEAEVRRSGITLAILGLGPNGHLGFNEPGSAFDSATRAVPLTPESIVSNARYWGGEDQVPRQAFTLGLGTLALAKETILLVSGAHKSGILARVLLEAPSPEVPATALRALPRCTVLADQAALADIPPQMLARLAEGGAA
jgi:glucosamine-6-phosphate deaminase